MIFFQSSDRIALLTVKNPVTEKTGPYYKKYLGITKTFLNGILNFGSLCIKDGLKRTRSLASLGAIIQKRWGTSPATFSNMEVALSIAKNSPHLKMIFILLQALANPQLSQIQVCIIDDLHFSLVSVLCSAVFHIDCGYTMVVKKPNLSSKQVSHTTHMTHVCYVA